MSWREHAGEFFLGMLLATGGLAGILALASLLELLGVFE